MAKACFGRGCAQRQLRSPKAFASADAKLTPPFSFIENDLRVIHCGRLGDHKKLDPRWALQPEESLLLTSFRGWGRWFARVLSTSKYPWFKPAAEPPSSNKFSPQAVQCYLVGRSALGHRLDFPTRRPAAARDGNDTRWPLPWPCIRYRASVGLLRFKGWAKSWYKGFIAKMFECISSVWVRSSAGFTPLSTLSCPSVPPSNLPPPPFRIPLLVLYTDDSLPVPVPVTSFTSAVLLKFEADKNANHHWNLDLGCLLNAYSIKRITIDSFANLLLNARLNQEEPRSQKSLPSSKLFALIPSPNSWSANPQKAPFHTAEEAQDFFPTSSQPLSWTAFPLQCRGWRLRRHPAWRHQYAPEATLDYGRPPGSRLPRGRSDSSSRRAWEWDNGIFYIGKLSPCVIHSFIHTLLPSPASEPLITLYVFDLLPG